MIEMTRDKRSSGCRRSRTALAATATLVAVVLAGLVAAPGAGAAQARDTGAAAAKKGVKWDRIRTDSCPCGFNQRWNWFASFLKDKGGVGVVATVYPSSAPYRRTAALFQAEWHPKGQVLRLRDLKADGDAFYVTLLGSDTGTSYGSYRVPSGQRSTTLRLDDEIFDGESLEMYINDSLRPGGYDDIDWDQLVRIDRLYG
ncbi:hypothetical protein [Nocardioides sp. L-11A]|uniref:hypothetical protein n=1 Tax=Nocardioides sp. L-11A TaxID=3043848 RepID=UPI00249BD6C4|nr:hypothetical protein QJ852_04240 [Nocardioides sp. L-11A]